MDIQLTPEQLQIILMQNQNEFRARIRENHNIFRDFFNMLLNHSFNSMIGILYAVFWFCHGKLQNIRAVITKEMDLVREFSDLCKRGVVKLGDNDAIVFVQLFEYGKSFFVEENIIEKKDDVDFGRSKISECISKMMNGTITAISDCVSAFSPVEMNKVCKVADIMFDEKTKKREEINLDWVKYTFATLSIIVATLVCINLLRYCIGYVSRNNEVNTIVENAMINAREISQRNRSESDNVRVEQTPQVHSQQPHSVRPQKVQAEDNEQPIGRPTDNNFVANNDISPHARLKGRTTRKF